MALSDRSRKKRAGDAQKMLEPGTAVRRFANGVTGPYPTNTILLLVLSAVGITVVLSLLFGSVVGPGVIAVLLVYWAFNPPRALAVTDRGVVLFKRSMWTGKPTHVISLLSPGALQSAQTRGGYVQVLLGPETVWFTKREWAALAGA
jgi:hypothetical protein